MLLDYLRKKLLKLKDFVIEYSGSGDNVINQSPEGGTRLIEGSSIRLYLG